MLHDKSRHNRDIAPPAPQPTLTGSYAMGGEASLDSIQLLDANAAYVLS
jgi:hypothetical protein